VLSLCDGWAEWTEKSNEQKRRERRSEDFIEKRA
jgi:hypothetical protein